MALEHWLQLSLTSGIGPILSRRLIETAGSVEAACEATGSLLKTVEGIGSGKASNIATSLRDAKSKAQRELERTSQLGIGIICPDDSQYPAMLASIPDPPMVLYVRGALQPRDLNGVAIVGSRRCSHYGREQANRFATSLAGVGVTVISGGARGIDSSAHQGAISHPDGRTIAVLGSGLDVPYPPENAGLFSQIAAGHGVVMSEFALGTDPNRENFPRRNRIVSGLSRAVLVIEADERSGALITARQAGVEHGRPVLALPGRVDNPLSAGPHQLIRDGAVLVTNLGEVLDALGPLPDQVFQPIIEDKPRPVEMSAGVSLTLQQELILTTGIGEEAASIDMIIDRTALPAHVVMQELTYLTLKGQVRRIDGQTFAPRRSERT